MKVHTMSSEGVRTCKVDWFVLRMMTVLKIRQKYHLVQSHQNEGSQPTNERSLYRSIQSIYEIYEMKLRCTGSLVLDAKFACSVAVVLSPPPNYYPVVSGVNVEDD